MHPEALILRRCYPVPVTFADLRATADMQLTPMLRPLSQWWSLLRTWRRKYPESFKTLLEQWTAGLKTHTGALDEVYAVVDGREVRITVVQADEALAYQTHRGPMLGAEISDLLIRADEQGYWERPREVRLDLSPRPVSHGEVARAVLVGQQYAERRVMC